MKLFSRLKHRKNGDEVKEHPKPMIELIEGTREAIEGYRQAADLTFQQAAEVLILNELRCIHWHYDDILAKEITKPSEKG